MRKHREISSKHKHPGGHDRRFQLEKWHENHGIDISISVSISCSKGENTRVRMHCSVDNTMTCTELHVKKSI